MKRIVWLALPALMLLAACGAPAQPAPVGVTGGAQAMVVYLSPT